MASNKCTSPRINGSPKMNIHEMLNPILPEIDCKAIRKESPFPSPESATIEFPKKKFQCTEVGCYKTFTRKYNLSAHQRCHRGIICSLAEKPFGCHICPLKFARKHDLARHVRSIHEGRKNYGPCPHCDSYFTRSDALTRHIKIEQDRLGAGVLKAAPIRCSY